MTQVQSISPELAALAGTDGTGGPNRVKVLEAGQRFGSELNEVTAGVTAIGDQFSALVQALASQNVGLVRDPKSVEPGLGVTARGVGVGARIN